MKRVDEQVKQHLCAIRQAFEQALEEYSVAPGDESSLALVLEDVSNRPIGPGAKCVEWVERITGAKVFPPVTSPMARVHALPKLLLADAIRDSDPVGSERLVVASDEMIAVIHYAGAGATWSEMSPPVTLGAV